MGEHGQSAKLLKMKLDELATCFELLSRHLDALQQQGPGAGAEPDAASAKTGVLAPSISTSATVTPLTAHTPSIAASIAPASAAPASAPAVSSGAAVVAPSVSVAVTAQPVASGSGSSASSTLLNTAAAASPSLSRNFVERAALYRLTAEAMHKVRPF